MKIFHIGPFPVMHNGVYFTGGVATAVKELTEWLSLHKDSEIFVFADTFYTDKASQWHEQKGNYHIFKPIRKRISNIHEFFQLFGVWIFCRQIFLYTTDKIRQILFKKERNYKYALASLYYQKIIQSMNPDIIHAHHAHERAIVAWHASGGRIPIVVTLHSFHGLLGPRPAKFVELYKKTFTIAKKMIAVSHFIKMQAIELGAKKEETAVIHNGLNTNEFVPASRNTAREKLNFSQETKIVLFVGSLIERKGIDILMQSFSRLKPGPENIKLVIIGNGPLEKKLRRLRAKLTLDNSVTFLGSKQGDELRLWYCACDILVVPSRQESQGIVVLEAMACGKAVIGSNVGGIPDMIKDKETGILFEPEGVPDLTAKIEKLLGDEKLCDYLGQNARAKVERDFTWEQVAGKTMELYRELRQ